MPFIYLAVLKKNHIKIHLELYFYDQISHDTLCLVRRQLKTAENGSVPTSLKGTVNWYNAV